MGGKQRRRDVYWRWSGLAEGTGRPGSQHAKMSVVGREAARATHVVVGEEGRHDRLGEAATRATCDLRRTWPGLSARVLAADWPTPGSGNEVPGLKLSRICFSVSSSI